MIPWSRKCHPTLVFLSRELHGQKSLVGYGPWGCKEKTRMSTHIFIETLDCNLPWLQSAPHGHFLTPHFWKMLSKFFSPKDPHRTLLHYWWECKLVQPLWRTVWRFIKKLEIELPYDPAIPLLGIHTEETRSERDMCTPMFIAALFTIARTRKQP